MTEFEGRIEELRAEFDRKLRRRTRLMAAAVAVATVLAVTPIALAATFGDVPVGNIFREDISRVADAGIAAGCGGGNYCPKANVTREQMAAFLQRSAGRVSFADFDYNLTDGQVYTVRTVGVRAGNVTGGTALVRVTASWEAWSSQATGFPYEVTATLIHGLDVLGTAKTQITSAVGSYSARSGTLDWVVQVPTGVNELFSIQFQRTLGAQFVGIKGTLVAEYIPFLGDGSAAG